MKLFFENITEKEFIPMEKALDAVPEQALDVFDQLPEDDGSFLGLLTDDGTCLQFSKFNRFMWLVELIDNPKKEKFKAICNPNQCRRIIIGIFDGKNPIDLADFES